MLVGEAQGAAVLQAGQAVQVVHVVQEAQAVAVLEGRQSSGKTPRS